MGRARRAARLQAIDCLAAVAGPGERLAHVVGGLSTDKDTLRGVLRIRAVLEPACSAARRVQVLIA
jgi:hypothetical protein